MVLIRTEANIVNNQHSMSVAIETSKGLKEKLAKTIWSGYLLKQRQKLLYDWYHMFVYRKTSKRSRKKKVFEWFKKTELRWSEWIMYEEKDERFFEKMER